MSDPRTQLIDVSRLRIGLYIHLDTSWINHPFALGSFKIQSQEQIDTIRSLGMEQIRYSPDKSDPEPEPAPATTAAPVATENPELAARRLRRELLARQHASLQVCERQFAQAAQTYRHVAEAALTRPDESRTRSEALVHGLVEQISGDDETCIRLLSEKAGERSSLHAINVTIISLLLGKASKLDEQTLMELGMGALLHDIGKTGMPERLRSFDPQFTAAEQHAYREHVRQSVELARKMELSSNALLVIGQHHEFADGSGYPLGVTCEHTSLPSRIVALVNQYDNLCNPGNPVFAMTPHDALSLMFSQMREKHHATTMSLFVRMMGVYPPGSVVQLTNDRYALVVSVNSSRPLKPRIVVHNPRIPSEEALILDLENEPDLGIRRSLKPVQLPRAAFDYLSPRKRMCYFFERAREPEAPIQ